MSLVTALQRYTQLNFLSQVQAGLEPEAQAKLENVTVAQLGHKHFRLEHNRVSAWTTSGRLGCAI